MNLRQETFFSYGDLRDWLDKVDRLGELKVVRGAHWDLEMGGLAEIVAREAKGEAPALLFDEIADYQPGYRALFAQFDSVKRLALTLNLAVDGLDRLTCVRACRDKLSAMQLLPPRFVERGKVVENVDQGEKIDLLRFPVPKHHEKDGGR